MPRQIEIYKGGAGTWLLIDGVELPADWISSAVIRVDTSDQHSSVTFTLRAERVVVEVATARGDEEVSYGEAERQDAQAAAQ